MLWVNIKRVIRAGFMSFWRNAFVSLASVLVMTVTLFVIGSVIFLLATLDSSLTDLENKVDVNVYINTTAAEEEIESLKKTLVALPEVKSVIYISREEALENFKKRHENDSPVLEALGELDENPLNATLNIIARDPEQYESIARFLETENALSRDQRLIVKKVNYEDNRTAIEVLSKIISSARKLGMAATLILVVISVLIIFNTIRLAIYTAREEISVMQLVGASNKYVRGPFIISGIMYGVVAALLALGAFYPLTYWLGSATENFFSGINVYRYYLANFGEIFIIILGAGVFLGAVSSFMAVRRYLNV